MFVVVPNSLETKKRAREEEEKFKPWILSYLRTAGKSRREVGVNVYQFRSYWTNQQSVLTEYTGVFRVRETSWFGLK